MEYWAMLVPTFEQEIINSGYHAVVGIDEAGRGAWAGPVAVGYYVYTTNLEVLGGVNDSKKLSQKRRAQLYTLLSAHGGVEYSSALYIDNNGITKAIVDAIFKIVYKLKNANPNANFYFLIDGQFANKFDVPHSFVIKGDSKHYSIAAASILAKHGRDSLMQKLHETYPEYGFGSHKGYGTAEHKKNLLSNGVLSVHRKTYSPIKEIVGFENSY